MAAMPEFFPTFRDPLLSLFQSAVKEVACQIESIAAQTQTSRRLRGSSLTALQSLAAEIAEREYCLERGESPPPSPATNRRDLSKLGMARVCAELALRYLRAVAVNDHKAISQIADEFTAGTCDPAWLSTLEQYRKYFGPNGQRKAIPYVLPSVIGPKSFEIKSGARIALIGDWGTGTRPAIELLQLVADDEPDLVVHLGDIYYSGTPKECQEHFADVINRVLRRNSPVPVFTLSANHDMYCGGVGFYELIGRLNPEPYTQTASFFCLRSSDSRWQLLAMDTGLHDDNPLAVGDTVTFLEDDELAWHCDRIDEFPGRTILLSHHQLFSGFSPIGPSKSASDGGSSVNLRLLNAFQQMSAKKEIAAWFWGHEHSLSIYESFVGLNRGRCIGHGAVPVSITDDIYKPLKDRGQLPKILDGTRLGTSQGVYNHGYVLLELKEQCIAEYVEANGTGRHTVYVESIV
jgi:Calcineurin-like phosphoesterase